MKQFFALYVKELKANKTLFLFLLLLIVGLNVYGLILVENFKFLEIKKETGGHIQILNIPWSGLAALIFVFSLPFLLAHAFNTEWKSETHYLMFGLPVTQYKVILSKIAAVASKGIVGGVIVTIGLFLWIVREATSSDAAMMSIGEPEVAIRTYALSLFFLAALVLVTYMVFILGLVTGMEGVKFAVKRYRGLTAVVFFIFAVFVYGRLFQHGEQALDFLGEFSVFDHLPPIELAPFVYTILMGVIFMIIGLVVYEKRAEI